MCCLRRRSCSELTLTVAYVNTGAWIYPQKQNHTLKIVPFFCVGCSRSPEPGQCTGLESPDKSREESTYQEHDVQVPDPHFRAMSN